MEQNILYPKDFIKVSIIENLGKLIPKQNEHGLPYEAFILIAIAIEFIGATEDDFDWHKERQGKPRFYNGLKLMGSEYYYHKEILYKKLRCGLAHVYAPVYGLGLGEIKHATSHLLEFIDNNQNKYLCLQVEKFYHDLCQTSIRIIEKIDKMGYPMDHKIYKPFLAIPK
jgi:hypothetical protein